MERTPVRFTEDPQSFWEVYQQQHYQLGLKETETLQNENTHWISRILLAGGSLIKPHSYKICAIFHENETITQEPKEQSWETWKIISRIIYIQLRPNQRMSNIFPDGFQNWYEPVIPSVQFSSVAQSCLTLCHPMNHSTTGLPVHHHLPEFSQTHVHQVGDAIQPSHPLSSPFPPAPNPSQRDTLLTPIFWPPDAKNWLIWKDPDAEKDWRQEKRTEDEMVGWHHQLNGHGFG